MSPKTLPYKDSERPADASQHPVSQEGPIDLPALPGDVIAGKYEVIARIGAGAMGQVFSALHRELGERVALKFLRREALAHPELVQRFALEARAAARIRSEHVARVFDVGALPNGIPYIVMELLQGETLSDLLVKRGAMPPEVAVDFALHVCEALASAHAKGVVHRDIKPDNLFLVRNGSGPQTIKVLDFGVSKLGLGERGAAGERPSMPTTLPVGSPAYMSPEQIRSFAEVDPRTDVWSLGCTLFELLTATMPFEGSTLIELRAAILEKDPVRLRARLASAPPELEAVISRCLEKDPERRFANVAELAQALAPFASERARVYVERCQFLLPESGPLESSPRIELRRSIPAVPVNDPATTVPALVRPARRQSATRAPLFAALALTGLAAAYLLGRLDDERSASRSELVTAPLTTPVALTPAASEAATLTAATQAPTFTAAIEAPLVAQPETVALPSRRLQPRPTPRAKPSGRAPKSFGRPSDEAFDVGY